MKTAYIFSPNSAQSLAIAMYLRRYYPDAKIIGITLNDELMIGHPRVYSYIIPISQLESKDINGVLIPTGSKSTKYLLEKGDVSIGSVTLTQHALWVYDKPWVIAWASKVGVPTPATWQRITDVASFPAFYKPRYEEGGGPRGVAQAESDIAIGDRNNLIYQELVDSQGTYGVGFLAERGQLIASCAHFERESVPKAGGSAVIIEQFEDPRLLEYTRRLIRSLNYSGWGLAEFKYHPQRHDFVFMEINAKFWASCEFSFMNEPQFLKLLFGIDSREKPAQRMIFVDRAFARGLLFVLANIPYVNGSIIRAYPSLFRSVMMSLIPSSLRRGLLWLFKKARSKWNSLN